MKDSFILYKDQQALIEKLTDEQVGKLFKAVYQYQNDGTIPEMDAMVDIVFTAIKLKLDRDAEKYEETCKARAEAGSKGGKQRVAKQAKASKSKQKVANQADNEHEHEHDCDNNNISSPSNDDGDTTKDAQLSEDFEKIWSEYPRKEGKAEAFKKYKSWLKGRKVCGKKVKLSNKQIWYAVQAYKQEIKDKNTESQYVKHGSTFFGDALMDFIEKGEPPWP